MTRDLGSASLHIFNRNSGGSLGKSVKVGFVVEVGSGEKGTDADDMARSV
jgi:hypothetical protein